MHHQRGNILFLILLAIILFAALTYAVNSGMQGGGKNATAETDRAGAAAVLGHAAALQNALMRMTTTGGYRLEQLSFVYTQTRYDGVINSNAYNNAACTTDECRVFKPAGGGVAPISFEKYAVPEIAGWQATYPKPGFYDMFMVQWPGAKTDANDLVMRVMGLKSSVCKSIRDTLNLQGEITLTGTGIGVYDTASWDNAAYTVSPAQNAYGHDIGVSHTASAYCFVYIMMAAR